MRYQKARVVKVTADMPPGAIGSYLWVEVGPPRTCSVTDLYNVECGFHSIYTTDIPDGDGDYLVVNSEIVELEPEFKESAS